MKFQKCLMKFFEKFWKTRNFLIKKMQSFEENLVSLLRHFFFKLKLSVEFSTILLENSQLSNFSTNFQTKIKTLRKTSITGKYKI